MSDFISAINPWIEDAAFDAIMHSNTNSNSKQQQRHQQQQQSNQKIRFVQVLQRQSASSVIISDCKTQILCRTTRSSCDDNDNIGNGNNNENIMPPPLPTNIQKGSVVKLKNYKFVLNSDMEQNPAVAYAIELVTDSLEFAGAQGMGIIGDPLDLMETVQVRRALQHIQHNVHVLKERLLLSGAPRVDKGKKRGDALALLQQEELLDQLLSLGDDIDDDDDDDGGDNIETQDVLIMTQEYKIQHKRKDDALENNGNGTTKKKLRKGNVLALLGDDAKLERVLGMHADGDDDHGLRPAEDIDDGANGGSGEYVMTLKDPPPRASPLRKRTRVSSSLDTERLTLPSAETHQHEGGDDRLEHENELDDEDDAESSVSSDPVGISEMLSSPTSKTSEFSSKKQVVDKLFQLGPSVAKDSTTASIEGDASIPIVSNSRLNRQQSGGNDFMQRWRNTRTFYKRLWEQRHDKVVIF